MDQDTKGEAESMQEYIIIYTSMETKSHVLRYNRTIQKLHESSFQQFQIEILAMSVQMLE